MFYQHEILRPILSQDERMIDPAEEFITFHVPDSVQHAAYEGSTIVLQKDTQELIVFSFVFCINLDAYLKWIDIH
jgi:hypothetical protein